MTDWTEDLKRFGESRQWAGLPRRHALKQFRDFCDWDVPEGFHVATAFTACYEALKRASPDSRAACHSYDDLKALQRSQAATDDAIRELNRGLAAAKRMEELQEFVAAIDNGHPALVWPQGLYTEDVLCGKQVAGRDAYDALVRECRNKCDMVNNRLGVETCYVAAALLDSNGRMLTEHGLRVG